MLLDYQKIIPSVTEKNLAASTDDLENILEIRIKLKKNQNKHVENFPTTCGKKIVGIPKTPPHRGLQGYVIFAPTMRSIKKALKIRVVNLYKKKEASSGSTEKFRLPRICFVDNYPSHDEQFMARHTNKSQEPPQPWHIPGLDQAS
ncbi:hypothetical protein [Desulfoplanes formicivorans]|uniref:hypothetical protein n=1 Tax=Desulfoplanes formicivorans TaxID=1592317 RepID=UPI00114C8849|nr:hypothetical protein [Desulfoplanes formicivorans]